MGSSSTAVSAGTPVGLRHATVGHSHAAIRTAFLAGLRGCPLPDLPADPHFADLVVFWLTDAEGWEWLPPPLTEDTIEAIYRHLVARAHRGRDSELAGSAG
jgi:hypothetical protein